MAYQAVELKDHINKRVASYVLTFIFFSIIFYFSRGSDWLGNGELHTVMEVIATLLAFLVGVMALVRYYSKKNSTLLVIGTAFLGTAMLDGYHAIVTSTAFAPYLPSDLPALIPWSWVASRFFLSLLLFMSWAVWKFELNKAREDHIKEHTVYLIVAVLTMISFVFFAFYPLPRAYYPEYMFGRPEEFIPAVLFIFALAGYLKKAKWKYDIMEHWLVLALIVSVVSQALFMPFSFGLFDFDFDMAHLLKKVTYILVMIGLLFSMYDTFRRVDENTKKLATSNKKLAETNAELQHTISKRKTAEQLSLSNTKKLEAIFKTVPDGIITTDLKGEVLAFNSAAESLFGYTSSNIVGRNVKILMPEAFAENHDEYMSGFEKGDEAIAIGKRRELKGLRKDGSTFIMDLTINQYSDDSNERSITGIIRDITAEKQAADKLVKSAAELAKTNEELEQFAYIASHDLKAPLRGINNLASFIKEDFGDNINEETLNNFDLMQNRIVRMEKLLDDLLSYSRVGRILTSFEEVDITELLDNIKTLISPPDGFEILVSGEKCIIHTLQAPLQQTLTNVIGNAIKHHDLTTGKITVDVNELEGFIKFTIKDDGPGIPQEFHRKIFKMFQTIKPRDDVEGSGIGLAVVKKSVESFGGSIEIYSNEDERGSKFTILWPKNIERAGKND